MTELSWAHGLALWLLFAGIALWVVGEIAHRFGTPDDEWDRVAEQKRRNAKKARHLSREFR